MRIKLSLTRLCEVANKSISLFNFGPSLEKVVLTG